MINLNEIKVKAARKNSHNNNRLHFFSSKISIYFSWIFINLGMSANQVTITFFITGLLGAISFMFSDFSFIFAGYILWRMHIVFDLCDGDVARFNQQFSINGAYWDYMIHSTLYPLVYIAISISLYREHDNEIFLFLGIIGSLIVSQMLAVKNNYYRAMLFNNIPLDTKLGENKQTDKTFILSNAIKSLLSFEGFLFVYLVSNLFFHNDVYFIALMVSYAVIFLMIVLVKFFLFSKQGFYNKRS